MWGVDSVQECLQLQAESCDKAIGRHEHGTRPRVIVEIGFDKALRRAKTIVTENSK